MNAEIFYDCVMPAASRLFKTSRHYSQFVDPRAQAMILTIGMMESEFRSRQQLIGSIRDWWKSERGPAVSYLQFERIGVRGVLEHHSTARLAEKALEKLGYPAITEVVFQGMKHNDIVASVMGRLALWRHPDPLPEIDEPEKGYRQYLDIWAPGKPKDYHTWLMYWVVAWEIVEGRSNAQSLN